MWQQAASSRSAKSSADQGVYVSYCILIARRMSQKRADKSYIAFVSSHMHSCWFYSLLNYCYYPVLVPTKQQFLHELIVRLSRTDNAYHTDIMTSTIIVSKSSFIYTCTVPPAIIVRRHIYDITTTCPCIILDKICTTLKPYLVP